MWKRVVFNIKILRKTPFSEIEGGVYIMELLFVYIALQNIFQKKTKVIKHIL